MRLADTPVPTRAGGQAGAVPAGRNLAPDADDPVFRAALAALCAGREAVTSVRDDLELEDWPAPKRLAPHAAALAVTAYRDGVEVGDGKLMLLYDPDGRDGWTGTFRIVAQVHADVDEEMAADPLLGEVGWSWLTEALDLHAPGYGAPSGTVTRVITEGYGAKADEPPSTGFELRASWCPAGQVRPADGEIDDETAGEISGAVAAWCDLLAAAAGLPAQGTVAIGARPANTQAPRPGGRRRR